MSEVKTEQWGWGGAGGGNWAFIIFLIFILIIFGVHRCSVKTRISH